MVAGGWAAPPDLPPNNWVAAEVGQFGAARREVGGWHAALATGGRAVQGHEAAPPEG